MAVNFFFIKIETRKCNNESQSAVIRINGEKRVLVFALFCGIFNVDPTFLHHFQMPNKTLRYDTKAFKIWTKLCSAPSSLTKQKYELNEMPRNAGRCFAYRRTKSIEVIENNMG